MIYHSFAHIDFDSHDLLMSTTVIEMALQSLKKYHSVIAFTF